MLFEKDVLVFGVHPRILRDGAWKIMESTNRRYFEGESFTLTEAGKAWGATESEAISLLDAMIAEGWIEKRDDVYIPLRKFKQASIARIGEPLLRKEAERLLKRVVEVAASINAQPEKHKATVDCIAVFGSYLTQKAALGDLDLFVRISRIPELDENRAWSDPRQTVEGKVKALLRLRKPGLVSVHDWREAWSLDAPYRVVFGREPEHPAPRR
jgi:predicted nucleotidyltransferase